MSNTIYVNSWHLSWYIKHIILSLHEFRAKCLSLVDTEKKIDILLSKKGVQVKITT